jgi:hypothetical protein
MQFEIILFLLLSSYGVCFALMNDKAKFLTDALKSIPIFVTEKGSFFERMLICSYCTGFHTGWLCYLIAMAHPGVSINLYGNIVEIILTSFASAIFCYSVDVIIQWFER